MELTNERKGGDARDVLPQTVVTNGERVLLIRIFQVLRLLERATRSATSWTWKKYLSMLQFLWRISICTVRWPITIWFRAVSWPFRKVKGLITKNGKSTSGGATHPAQLENHRGHIEGTTATHDTSNIGNQPHPSTTLKFKPMHLPAVNHRYDQSADAIDAATGSYPDYRNDNDFLETRTPSSSQFAEPKQLSTKNVVQDAVVDAENSFILTGSASNGVENGLNDAGHSTDRGRLDLEVESNSSPLIDEGYVRNTVLPANCSPETTALADDSAIQLSTEGAASLLNEWSEKSDQEMCLDGEIGEPEVVISSEVGLSPEVVRSSKLVHSPEVEHLPDVVHLTELVASTPQVVQSQEVVHSLEVVQSPEAVHEWEVNDSETDIKREEEHRVTCQPDVTSAKLELCGINGRRKSADAILERKQQHESEMAADRLLPLHPKQKIVQFNTFVNQFDDHSSATGKIGTMRHMIGLFTRSKTGGGCAIEDGAESGDFLPPPEIEGSRSHRTKARAKLTLELSDVATQTSLAEENREALKMSEARDDEINNNRLLSEETDWIRRRLMNTLRSYGINCEDSVSLDQILEHLKQALSTKSAPPDGPAVNQSVTEEEVTSTCALGIANEEELAKLSVRQIRSILAENSVDFDGCFEKSELVAKITQLWKDLNKHAGAPPDADRCLVCMDARIDCVFLECGHMCTCNECGHVIKDCPICRMYITRVVRTYRP